MKALKLTTALVALMAVSGAANAAPKAIVDLTDFNAIGDTATETTAITAANTALDGAASVAGSIAKYDAAMSAFVTAVTDADEKTKAGTYQTEINALVVKVRAATTKEDRDAAVAELKAKVEAFEADTFNSGVTERGAANTAFAEIHDAASGTLFSLVSNQNTLVARTTSIGSTNIADIAGDTTNVARFVADVLVEDVKTGTAGTAALGKDMTLETALQSFTAVEQRLDTNSAAISSNTRRIVSLEEDVSDLEGGVAMAIAMANAPVVSGGANGFSLSGGFGHFKGNTAGAVKAAFLPMENVAITASVATDFEDNISAGGGIGFAF